MVGGREGLPLRGLGSSSLGTTRGGKTVASASGYLKYEGTNAERSFSLSVVVDGEWYVSSFSVGRLAEPY
ncbi:MAG: hypothetical protein U0235_18370 [Polyangiaceae bacterium]